LASLDELSACKWNNAQVKDQDELHSGKNTGNFRFLLKHSFLSFRVFLDCLFSRRSASKVGDHKPAFLLAYDSVQGSDWFDGRDRQLLRVDDGFRENRENK
jgi:hypothetical protein